ncbi:YhfC family glutamic-type intramembrane protease, partial [Lacticaseibacillus paracasei]
YVLGHGGLELILIGSLTMFSNFMFAMLINGGKVNEMLEKVPASSRSVLNTQVKQLMATTGWTISLSLMERLLALAVQIALSVVVWIIIMKRMRWFWLLLP